MRRAPIDGARAAQAADVLEEVSRGRHPRTSGPWVEALATRKLGELVDETGGILAAGDPDLEAAFRHELDLEVARWGPDPDTP